MVPLSMTIIRKTIEKFDEYTICNFEIISKFILSSDLKMLIRTAKIVVL